MAIDFKRDEAFLVNLLDFVLNFSKNELFNHPFGLWAWLVDQCQGLNA